MKNTFCFTVLILFLAFTCAFAAGKPGSCSNVPISVTFLATNAASAAMWNDDPSQPYTGGPNTQIHICDGGPNMTGSYDAKLTTAGSRKVKVKFPLAIPGSQVEGGPASFAGGNEFSTSVSLGIQNIMGRTVIEPGIAATYYTRMAMGFTGPDKSSYTLPFYPNAGSCPGDFPCVPDLHGNNDPASKNLPEETSWVRVTYTPRPNPNQPWSTTNADTWIVDGDTEIQRATLFYVPRSGPKVHLGQYSMPFKILVTALAPLPQ